MQRNRKMSPIIKIKTNQQKPTLRWPKHSMYVVNKDYKETFINLEKDLKDNVFEELEVNI